MIGAHAKWRLCNTDSAFKLYYERLWADSTYGFTVRMFNKRAAALCARRYSDFRPASYDQGRFVFVSIHS